MRVYLIRHGQSEDAEAGLSQRKDSPLSETGKQQLASLKPEFQKIPFTQIYHSPWRRAKETAQLLFNDSQTPLKEVPYIHEYQRPSHLEGIDRNVVQKFWEDNLDNLYKPDWKPSDGESFKNILNRAKKLKKLLLSHDNSEIIGVVSHGILFKHLVGFWLIGNNYNPFIFSNLLRHIQLDNLGYISINFDKDKKAIRINKWHNFKNNESNS